MESSDCSTQPSLDQNMYPKSPSPSEELDEKKPLAPLRPKTPNSPDPNCAICLGKLQNTSFTDSCLHQFCFTCLLEWSKVKPECPLCKQTFKSIIHNVRSIEDYDQYHLHPASTTRQMWSAFDEEIRRRRQMFQAGLWHTPTLMQGRNMQAFLPGEGAVIPTMARVPLLNLREVASSEFRRSIYERNVWAEPLCDVTGRFRECTAEFFRQNEAAVHRLLPWLNRELDAVLWNGVNKSHVLELILNLLPRYNIGSSEFRNQLAPYLRSYVTHFLHEFYNFARSPYDMIGFDRSVIYSQAGQRTFLVVSSDDDESDGEVVVLSSPDRSTVVASPGLLSVQNRNVDAVAGPSQQATTSYEQAMERLARRVVENDAALNSDNSTVDLEVNDSDSDCLIVGFVKPRHERTPEIITLASDEERRHCAEERRHCAEDTSRRVSHSLDLTTSSESPLTSQTSDSDYNPSKSRSKCRKRKKMKGRNDSKITLKEKLKKSHQHATYKSHKSTSSGSKAKKLKRIKELFSSSSSSSTSSSSSSSSSSDEEIRTKKKTKRNRKSHYKGTWHVKSRGTPYDDIEDESLRDHNYLLNHNPPYSREEINSMQLQTPRNPPKLKSIVITRTFADSSPSVSGCSSHHQSHSSSSKHSHSHRSSRKRSKHDKKRSDQRDKRRHRFSSSDTSACKRPVMMNAYYSDSDDSC